MVCHWHYQKNRIRNQGKGKIRWGWCLRTNWRGKSQHREQQKLQFRKPTASQSTTWFSKNKKQIQHNGHIFYGIFAAIFRNQRNHSICILVLLQCGSWQILLPSDNFPHDDVFSPSDANINRKSQSKNYHSCKYHHLRHFFIID